MPKTLSKNPDQTVVDLLVNNWGDPSVDDGGYVANPSDPTASDALVITTNWAGFGDTFPVISLTNTDPTVPGGGDTQVTGVQGDGSGANQRRLENITMTVMAEEKDDGDYQGEDADDLVRILYEHAFQIVWNNRNAPNHAEITGFYPSPGTNTTTGEDSTLTQQYSGSVTVDWTKTP